MVEQNVKIKDATVEGLKDGKPILVEEAVVEGTADKIPQQSISPTTTEQQDITTAGQRRINLIWETTQAAVAIMVTIATIYAAIAGVKSDILSNAFTLIVAIYFVRMNHVKTGGIGGTDDR